MKVLAGLTLLDTEQGNTGMPLVAEHVEGHQRKAVLNFHGDDGKRGPRQVLFKHFHDACSDRDDQ